MGRLMQTSHSTTPWHTWPLALFDDAIATDCIGPDPGTDTLVKLGAAGLDGVMNSIEGELVSWKEEASGEMKEKGEGETDD